MIYIAGDTHAQKLTWTQQIEQVLHAGDSIIVSGDFGVGFWDGEEAFYDHIAEQPYTVLFIDGNHENFERLNRYPAETWCGGKVHKLRHNLIHLMRGEVYTVEDCTIFAFGGGYSVDKARRAEGVSWWPQEMPSEDEYANANTNLARFGHQVDYIITHTAPSETVYYLSTLRKLEIKNDMTKEWQLDAFLDGIRQQVTYTHWYFGHFHADLELWRNQTVVFNTIRELKTGEIVRQWESYEG